MPEDGFGLASVVASLGKRRRWAEAVDFFAQSRRSGQRPNLFLASACINTARSWLQSLSLLITLRRIAAQPDAHIYASVESSCVKSANWQQAVGILAGHRLEAGALRAVTLNILGAAVAWPASLELISMKPADDRLVSHLSSLGRSAQWLRCLQQLAILHSSGHRRCALAANAAAGSCAELAWGRAIHVLAAWQMDVVGHNTAMKAAASRAGWMWAGAVLRNMAACRLPASMASYNSLLSAFALSEAWASCLGAFSELKAWPGQRPQGLSMFERQWL